MASTSRRASYLLWFLWSATWLASVYPGFVVSSVMFSVLLRRKIK